MSRLVTPRQTAVKAAGGSEQDGALSRIAKFVPSEVLAFFAMWTQAIASLPWKGAVPLIELGGAIVGLIITYVYFDRFFPQASPASRSAHKWISTGAFGVHAYNLSAGATPEYFIPGIALASTALITLISALYIPTETRS